MSDIRIRSLHELADLRAALELQKIYWGDDAEALVPLHVLVSFVNFGGHVLGAWDGQRLVGILIGFLGTDLQQSDRPAMANLLILSKRMVVLPEYRNQGIAYRLKLAQRDIAMKQGIRLISWTFDPLLSINAHFNFHKLGAVSYRYYKDYYGTDERFPNLSGTDRLLVDWWVTHRRVEERISGQRGALNLAQYLEADTTIVNPAVLASMDTPITPHRNGFYLPDGPMALLEIPADFRTIESVAPELATEWRQHIREAFLTMFARHYTVTDFVVGDIDGAQRAFYVLTYEAGFNYRMN